MGEKLVESRGLGWTAKEKGKKLTKVKDLIH